MTAIKVRATYLVDCPSWREAEQLVEQGQVNPDTIESEPGSRHPKDIVAFGLSWKIEEEHRKLFFDNLDDNEYQKRLESIKEHLHIWLDSLIDEIIQSNEREWS